jgi:hypothetical protein
MTITRLYRPEAPALDDLVEVLYTLLADAPGELPEERPCPAVSPNELTCFSPKPE